MGCVASQEPTATNAPDELAPRPTIGNNEDKQLPSSLKKEVSPSRTQSITFVGVIDKPTLLVRDQFHSKYDGSLMHKWRKVDILKVEGDDYSKIFVHFQGWADTFNQWIDLHSELDKVAPLLLLSKAQCSAGKALSEEELKITRDYLLTGEFRPQPLISDESRNTSSTRENSSTSVASLPLEFFVEGKMLDILDIFLPLNSKEHKKKWRKARIIHVDNRRIRITYIGWDSKFDETLDIYENADRISPLGTKTTEQSARSLSALKETSQQQNIQKLNDNNNEDSDGDDEDDDDEETVSTQDSSIANATTATTNSGLFQSFARFMSGGTSAVTTTVATGSKSPKKAKRIESGSSAVSEQTTGTKGGKKKKKSRHGKYASYEEARDDIMKKSAEEKAAELEKERKFLEALGRKKLHVIEVEGDGNCLFRAISHQLYLTEENHEILRRNCVDHLIAHKNRFCHFCADDFDEHLREMAKVGSWGDELEIRAMEEILDRHITIYSSEAAKLDEPINTNIEEEAILKGVTPIMLSYHGQNHYNSIYDERYPPPLPLRSTNLLLQSRMGLIDCRHGLPTANNSNKCPSNLNTVPVNNNVSHLMSSTSTNIPRSSLSRTSSGTGPTAFPTGNISTMVMASPPPHTTNNTSNYYYSNGMPPTMLYPSSSSATNAVAMQPMIQALPNQPPGVFGGYSLPGGHVLPPGMPPHTHGPMGNLNNYAGHQQAHPMPMYSSIVVPNTMLPMGKPMGANSAHSSFNSTSGGANNSNCSMNNINGSSGGGLVSNASRPQSSSFYNSTSSSANNSSNYIAVSSGGHGSSSNILSSANIGNAGTGRYSQHSSDFSNRI